MHIDAGLRAARGVCRHLPFFLLVVGLAQAKPRVIVLTDIGGDSDAEQSMVRLLVYANQLEIIPNLVAVADRLLKFDVYFASIAKPARFGIKTRHRRADGGADER